MKTKILPTGIVTTQRKVGKKIIVNVKRPTPSQTVSLREPLFKSSRVDISSTIPW